MADVAGDMVQIRKEMALTHGEFFRNLPNAFPGGGYQVNGNIVILEEGGRRLEITLGTEGIRQIALLELPKTAVTLTFTGYNSAMQQTAMEQFDRAFQRAGG